ncbi:MAG: DUF434 domain-containing protein [Acidobacteria bacterium]|nr:MAG: DUF434 domain-containing protein [Acidobacteriota bacterium]
MPDRRQNRGAHPKDAACFATAQVPVLRRACDELSWLLSRGYSDVASLKLVGDRHKLRLRQRKALQRCAVAEEKRVARRAREVAPAAIAGRRVLIDGYNVLLTVEAALAGAVVLRGRDDNLRDLAAMSSHYRRVRQTRPAIDRIGRWLARWRPEETIWFLDRPISNSGRLAGWLAEAAAAHAWPWRVRLVPNPDPILIAAAGEPAGDVVATADGGILDHGPPWLALARHVVEASVPDAWVVDLSAGGAGRSEA